MRLGPLMLVALHGWLPLIKAESKRAHVDHLTLAAIVWHESHGRPGEVFQEKDGACSVGLGGIRVPACDPNRAAELRDPSKNLRAAATILGANRLWCQKHHDRQCRAGDRVFPGGGAVNHYGGGGTAYAPVIKHLRAVLARELRHRD